MAVPQESHTHLARGPAGPESAESGACMKASGIRAVERRRLFLVCCHHLATPEALLPLLKDRHSVQLVKTQLLPHGQDWVLSRRHRELIASCLASGLTHIELVAHLGCPEALLQPPHRGDAKAHVEALTQVVRQTFPEVAVTYHILSL